MQPAYYYIQWLCNNAADDSYSKIAAHHYDFSLRKLVLLAPCIHQVLLVELEGFNGTQVQLRQQAGEAVAELVSSLAQQGNTKIGVLRTTSSAQATGLQAGTSAATVQQGLQTKEVQAVQLFEYFLGDMAQPSTVAKELFLALRLMDELGATAIVVEGVMEGEEGLAVMNRLRKAASSIVHLQQ